MKVIKTFKLFIGGEFPRTESGYTFPVHQFKSKTVYANLCQSSRKDFRNAVTAAQTALPSWQSKSSYNRAQILYRMAEMMESQRQEIQEILQVTLGRTAIQSKAAIDSAVDSLVYYAGFADKYQQVMGSVNPVSGPHHNFTSCEAVGVVVHLPSEKFDLATLVAQIAAIICSGNSLVSLLAEEGAAIVGPLSEIFATSDLPKGVINLLTGLRDGLIKQVGEHMEIHAISCDLTNKKTQGELREMSAGNFKRFQIPRKRAQCLDNIVDFVEFKTVWHPIGF
jgi:acyl-CoA reductase-like NAD-dependent aldehyde dehydrogenase